ncbi:hypothetical protein TrVE_jg10938 [Triparma verrucosa]|uniref:Uncharacterized protein n=1 Tax=Triparma verrucosa TaxID=1606542 RepID=A0A9W7EQJ1_9STRA|nr:hypothetical protein TrVE_jg10938 [Triparma verrucosa]
MSRRPQGGGGGGWGGGGGGGGGFHGGQMGPGPSNSWRPGRDGGGGGGRGNYNAGGGHPQGNQHDAIFKEKEKAMQGVVSDPKFADCSYVNVSPQQPLPHVTMLAFSPKSGKQSQGHTLALAGSDGMVRSYDVARISGGSQGGVGAGGDVITANAGGVESIAWEVGDASGRMVTTGHDGKVAYFDPRGGRGDKVKVGGVGLSLAVGGGGVACGTEDDEVWHIDRRTMKPVKLGLDGSEDKISTLAYSPKGDHLFVGGGEPGGRGTVKLFDVKEKYTLVHSLVAHTGNVYGVAFSPDSKWMGTGGGDALVGIWDLKELACVRTVGRLNCLVRSLSFSTDSKYVSSCGDDSLIDIAEIETGRRVHAVPTGGIGECTAWTSGIMAYSTWRQQGSIASVKLMKMN